MALQKENFILSAKSTKISATMYPTKKLSEICTIGDGNHSSKYPKKDEMVSIGIPFIRANNLYNGGISWDEMKFITKEKHEILKKGHLKTNDILFTNRGEIGKVAILWNDFDNSNLNSQIAWLRSYSELNYKFLYYFLISPIMQWFYLKEKNGTALQQLTIRQISNIEIPLPPLSSQLSIVARLDSAMTEIDEAHRQTESALASAREVWESTLESVFAGGGEGWEEKRLGEILQKTETINPTKRPEIEFIYLDVSSVNKETKKIENAVLLLGKDAPSRARKLIRTHDIIFATVRPTHNRVAIITAEYNQQVCSTGYFVLRSNGVVSSNFIYNFLRTASFNKQMEALQKWASYPAVTDTEVKQIKIFFPKSLPEQSRIVAHLDAVRAETESLEKLYTEKLASFDELRRSILQEAFS